MKTRITGPRNLLRRKLRNGKANPFWDLVEPWYPRKAKDKTRNDLVESEPIDDYEGFGIVQVVEVVKKGAEVHDYPCWIVVSNVDDKVPRYIDEERPTWSEWMNERHRPTIVDGVVHIPTDGRGSPLLGSQLAKLVRDGYTIKTLPEMRALMVSQAPEDDV